MNLTTEQLAAQGACSDPGTYYITAPPGTGKTRLASDIINHDRNTVALTFSRSAAREIGYRVESPVEHLGTISSYAMKILKDATTTEWSLCPEEINDRLIKETLLLYRSVRTSDLEQAIQNWPISDLYSKSERAAIAYENRLTGLGYKSHATVLRDATFLIKLTPEIELLVVDEAQDCSVEDWNFLDCIRAQRKVFIGDPHQSIYQFRGARPDLFVIRSRRAKAMELTHNFRSNPDIIRTASYLRGVTPEPIKTDSIQFAPGIKLDSAEAQDWLKRPGTHAILARTNAEVVNICEQLYKIDQHPTRNDVVRRFIRKIGGLASAQCSMHPEARALIMGAELGTMTPLAAFDRAIDALEDNIALPYLEELRPYSQTQEWIERAIDFDIQPDQSFHVGTIHSAKGSEWDHVWVYGADWPKRTRPENVDAQRKLMYVAITRSKQSVVISGADLGYGWWLAKEMGVTA